MRPFAAVVEQDLPRPRTAPDPAALAEPVAATDRQRAALRALNVETIGDLLENLPFRFDDFTQVQPLALLPPGDVTVLVTVESVSERRTSRRNLRIIQARVSDASGGGATLSWFNQRYLMRTLEPGMLLLVRGEVRAGARTPEISVRTFEIVATPDEAERGEASDVLGLAPVYHASSKISSRTVRDLAGAALAGVTRVGDPLPPTLRARAGLPLRRDAIVAGHRPRTLDEQRSARDRLAYEELLLLQIALLRHRAAVAAAGRAEALPPPDGLVDRYIAGLPFPLTGAQRARAGRDRRRPRVDRADAAPAAGRRRLRQDGRRAGAAAARARGRRPGRADGADRGARRPAPRDGRAAARRPRRRGRRCSPATCRRRSSTCAGSGSPPASR